MAFNPAKYTQNTKNIWFPDQREPIYNPTDPIDDYQFKEYWKREKHRCISGFYLADGQVFIPGFLYFHTVYAKCARHVRRRGQKLKVVETPKLRDLDWDISGDFEQCERLGKFYFLTGSRDYGKSVISASKAAHLYTFFDDSESIISSSEDSYIKLATDKVDDILLNIHPVFFKKRLSADWKVGIKAGWKNSSTNLPDPASSNSKILKRNYEMGSRPTAANGTRPGFHLVDEVGTLPNLIECIKEGDGCWWSGSDEDDFEEIDDTKDEEVFEKEEGVKPSCLAMFTGTGGNTVAEEAGEVFFNPEAYNILEFENTWEDGGKIGRFIPATRAKMAFKEPKTLAEYLGIDHPDLQRITILVSNEERALKEWWEPEYNKVLKSGNSKAITTHKVQWPLKPSDSFIVLDSNDYNTEAARVQQARLRNNGITGTPVIISHDEDGKLKHKFTDKLPITEFPCKTQNKDAPIVMWEPPISDPPKWLYVAGVDPYRKDEAKYSDSLGAVYIYKRMHNIMSEKYQDTFVAAYVARPKTQAEWNENARKLIKYYNATALVENDEMSFINYMLSKNEDHYLADTPDFVKQHIPTQKNSKKKKGISRAAFSIRNFLEGCYKNYLDEILDTEVDDDGNMISEVLGVTRIKDPMLLEETIKYNKRKGNYDRLVAVQLALAMAQCLMPLGKITNNTSSILQTMVSNTKTKSLFNAPKNRTATIKRRLFR